jgi:hypothetical protein
MIDTKMIANTNINTPFDIILQMSHISNLVLLRVELQTFAFVVIEKIKVT